MIIIFWLRSYRLEGGW